MEKLGHPGHIHLAYDWWICSDNLWRPVGSHDDNFLRSSQGREHNFQYGFKTDLVVSAGLELVLDHTKKLCIASFYRQCSTKIDIKIVKIPVSLGLWPLGANKTGFNIQINIRGKLSIIRCDE